MLQTDGYGAYKTLAARRNDIVLAHCWSHARRKFFDLAKGGSAPIADEILPHIGKLYAVEADIRGRSADARRSEKASPAKMAAWTTVPVRAQRNLTPAS